jgi:hypothetical protein
MTAKAEKEDNMKNFASGVILTYVCLMSGFFIGNFGTVTESSVFGFKHLVVFWLLTALPLYAGYLIGREI